MTDTQRPLSSRHEIFAVRYVQHGNKALAAREAGYSDRSTAYRLLKKPRVAARVEALQQSAMADAGISSARVVAELARIGFANMADYVGRDGRMNVRALTRDQAAAVVEFTETTSAAGVVTRRIKLADKLSALDKLGKHLGVFEADNLQQLQTVSIDPRDLARRVAFMLRDADQAAISAAIPASMLESLPVAD
jgi:phage terminase small subunit